MSVVTVVALLLSCYGTMRRFYLLLRVSNHETKKHGRSNEPNNLTDPNPELTEANDAYM